MVLRGAPHLIRAMVPALVLAACLEGEPLPEQAIAWSVVPTPAGEVNVAVVRPEEEGSEDHPVIIALPWGAGTADLVEGFVGRYWLTEPGARGYYVVSPEIRGPLLEASASDIVPALFAWMDAELTVDLDQVVLVGASNGGRGAFFAAVAEPARFEAILTLPGMYLGPPERLAALSGVPVWMLVGELDTGWVTATRETVTALRSQGVTVDVDVVPGQGHVMELNPVRLMDWIDAALGR